jgi:hypothetical protein
LPTAAQESAVRRAAAALVADGLAERDAERHGWHWGHDVGQDVRA